MTPLEKDNWLKIIIRNDAIYPDNFRVITDEFLLKYDTNLRQIFPFIRYLERNNLLKIDRANDAYIRYEYYQEMADFIMRGGFTVQEELFEQNISKLLLEIDHLKKQLSPDNLETINKLSSIANNVLSGLTLLAAAKVI